MTEKELTESEIMDALKCCKDGECYKPTVCPLAYKGFFDTTCKHILMNEVYHLLNLKNGKIEWLEKLIISKDRTIEKMKSKEGEEK